MACPILIDTSSIFKQGMSIEDLCVAAARQTADTCSTTNGYLTQIELANSMMGGIVLGAESRNLVREMKVLMEFVTATNVGNGFWDDIFRILRTYGDDHALVAMILQSRLALVHTEPSEAVEATRKPLSGIYSLEKDSLAREIAGAIIRLFDMARCLRLPLEAAILMEVYRNSTRGYKHGKTS